jgi:O-antigen/teichoic acid export membrane protein
MSGWMKILGKDSLVYGIGYGVTRFLQVIILPIIARSLSLSEFGYYSNYVIFYTFAGGLLIFGLDSAVTRFFFESDEKKYHRQIFSSALYFILFLGLLSLSFFFIFSDELLQLLAVPVQYASSITFVLLCIPASAINSYLLSWFKWKREKFKFLFNSGASVLFLLLPLLLVNQLSFLFIFQVIFWSQLTIAAMSLILARDYLSWTFSPKLLRPLLIYGFPWMLVFLFGASRNYMDRVFLTRFLSDEAYGVYNFSVRIATLLMLVITAFDMSFGPLAYSIWNKEGAKEFFARLQSIYVFLISAFAAAICVFSPLLIQILGGYKYTGAEKVLPILLFASIPLSLVNFSNLGSSYAKKSVISTLTLFIGFVVVLLLNLLLTRYYLQYGASSASLVGHLVIIAAGYYLSNRYYPIPFSFGRDATHFFLFLCLSLLSVNFHISGYFYYEILIKAAILAALVLIIGVLEFKKEFQKVLQWMRVR